MGLIKVKKNMEEYGFIQFITNLATKVMLPNGGMGSQYDMFFAKYYELFYDLDKTFFGLFGKKLFIIRSLHFKKEKMLEVQIDGLNNNEKSFINDYCAHNNVGVKFDNNSNITILQIIENSRGIKEDRK